jgi:hypothetical protein
MVLAVFLRSCNNLTNVEETNSSILVDLPNETPYYSKTEKFEAMIVFANKNKCSSLQST